MDNKQELLDEYRRQLQELTRKIDALSEESEQPAPVQPPQPPVQPQSPPQQKPARSGGIAPYYAPQYSQNPQPQRGGIPPYQPPRTNLNIQYPPVKPDKSKEGVIGRNLFAIVACLLILLGVCVFISTIYEYIPTAVKVVAIYALGFAMLGAGLALYNPNKNNFWLGVASCGLAELLICILTSYSYFEILSLPAAFVLILLWVLGSFRLTKIHPVVFKSIGYIGFILSLRLGLGQLTGSDTALYLSLLGSFGVLSVFFLVTNPKYSRMNTAIAFINVIYLCNFQDYSWHLPDSLSWLGVAAPLAILGIYHGVYLLRSGLVRNAYPFFAVLTVFTVAAFCSELDASLMTPVMLGILLVLWYLCAGITTLPGYQACYSCFAGFILLFLSAAAYIAEETVWYWLAAFTAAAYVLYFVTKKRDIAWLGLVCFGLLHFHLWRISDTALIVTFLAALGFFALVNSKLLRRDALLQTAWYAMVLFISTALEENLTDALADTLQMEALIHGLYYLLLAIINTGYLHLSLRRKPREESLSAGIILLLVIQGSFLLCCLEMIDSRFPMGAMLGIVSSLLIVSYSLHHLFSTKAFSKDLLMWQFVKFTLYTFFVLSRLDTPDILGSILMLLIAILAIFAGFQLDYKAVRTYGLVLSLLDVTGLMLFDIEYANSLQFSLGMVVCGVLCFIISFIYSKIAKATSDEDDPK